MSHDNDIVQLSIKNLLIAGQRYIIPMYQRNFAWGEAEITQLIQDIIDYMPEANNYYIGTLVVFERRRNGETRYETIDGQQRLTTLSLLASYLKNEHFGDLSWYKELVIRFESRPHSQDTFDEIFNKDRWKNDPSEVLREDQINTALLNGYQLIKRILPQKLKESKFDHCQFSKYLLDKVQIMRVKVPPDTDLNHYFEIMNNRGEQLEKHEVLKSRIMEVLKDEKESQNCLHVVWEACANMEKYVQMGFPPVQRDAIFGAKDWGRFDVKDFEELRTKINNPADELPDKDIETLDKIIEKVRGDVKQSKEDETPERFNTVINFPNFLLHVLRVQTELDIPLDDKRLISTFDTHLLKNGNAIEKVKKFTFDLLHCKFLYDQYVIKREFIKGTDGWSLKRFKWTNGAVNSRIGRGDYVNTFGDEDTNGADNRRILMLLSAFHVSTPTLVYKHWLNAALHYLFTTETNETIQAKDYLGHLESVAKSFVFDRFLSPNGGQDYFKMIYVNKGNCRTLRTPALEESMELRLSFGNIENNLVFNYLDYLLWDKYQEKNSIIKDYEFTFRSSVEHYYPQKPMDGHDSLKPETLNSFGNLCLISHSKNSRLSNFMPQAKQEYYQNNTIDSVKQYFMMNRYSPWNKSSIETHFKEMKEVLLNAIESKEDAE